MSFFWNLVIPTATYGCELWDMSDKAFQIYACQCKKVQRFYSEIPNPSSLHAIGCVFNVQVRKLLFIRSILALDDAFKLSINIFFCDRARHIFDRKLNNEPTMHLGVVNDLLKFAILFNLCDDIRNMVMRGHSYPKAALRMKVWDRAWALEDVYWRINFESRKSLDLLKRIGSRCRYLS